MADSSVAQAVAANNEFNVRPDSSGEDRKSYTYMYWRHPVNPEAQNSGWVSIGGAWATEFVRQSKKGMTPLPKYGEFLETNKDEGWSTNRNWYKRLFDRGGVHELPAEQVIALGWHRRPPVKGMAFPQLEGLELPEFICTHCRKVFSQEDHLRRHESIAHKDISGNSELARQLKANTSDPLVAVVQKMAERQDAMESRFLQLMEAFTQAVQSNQSRAPRGAAT